MSGNGKAGARLSQEDLQRISRILSDRLSTPERPVTAGQAIAFGPMVGVPYAGHIHLFDEQTETFRLLLPEFSEGRLRARIHRSPVRNWIGREVLLTNWRVQLSQAQTPKHPVPFGVPVRLGPYPGLIIQNQLLVWGRPTGAWHPVKPMPELLQEGFFRAMALSRDEYRVLSPRDLPVVEGRFEAAYLRGSDH